MPKEELQPEEYKTLGQAIANISDAVETLRFRAGVNYEAIVILLSDKTKLPKRTVRKVLDNLNELATTYCQEP